MEQFLNNGGIGYAIKCGLCIGLMFLCGFHYLPMVFVFVGVFALLHIKGKKSLPQIALRVLLISIFFVGFSAIKLLPSLQLLSDNEVNVGVITNSGYSIHTLWFSLFSRDMTQAAFSQFGKFRGGFVDGLSWELGENGMYIGVIAGVLFLLGLWGARKTLQPYYGVLFVFLWLAFGLNVMPSLFALSHEIELFTFMRVAQRYRFVFMMPVALFAAWGLQYCFLQTKRLLPSRYLFIVQIGVVVILGLDMLWVNTKVYRESFRMVPLSIPSPKPFVQVCGTGASWLRDEYPIVAQDLGMRDCKQNVVIPTQAVDCKDEAGYRGEAYVLHDPYATLHMQFSPNILDARVVVSDADTLVVNQNFDRGWKAMVNGKLRKVQETQKLLSVYVPKGESNVVFFYLPDAFIVGLSISLITVGYVWQWKRKK
jgi:hypothetical protein